LIRFLHDLLSEILRIGAVAGGGTRQAAIGEEPEHPTNHLAIDRIPLIGERTGRESLIELPCSQYPRVTTVLCGNQCGGQKSICTA